GAILVVDAHRPPFVSEYGDVKSFLAEGLKFPNASAAAALGVPPEDVEAIAVTGVGSSALGSAAFAWNVSEALHKPVAAIVPGFVLADVVLHAILKAAPQIKRLYAHSKGAFCLRNAIRDLPPRRSADLHVTTFGCCVAEETSANYNQILGTMGGRGQLNSWGALPEQWINAWHSTNTLLPMTMH